MEEYYWYRFCTLTLLSVLKMHASFILFIYLFIYLLLKIFTILLTQNPFSFSDCEMATENGEEQSLINLQKLQNVTPTSLDCSSDSHMVIKRPVYSQAKFDEGFESDKRYHETISSYCKKKFADCHCSSCLKLFPFLGIMRKYSLKNDFFSDLVAGLTVGIMHIPQGKYNIFPIWFLYKPLRKLLKNPVGIFLFSKIMNLT